MISIYDVLKASKGVHVDDTFAELWGRKLSNAYTVATYTGTLPATLQTVAGYLESYKIYGNTVQDGTPTPENPIVPSGCGERTENLYNKTDSSMNFMGYIFFKSEKYVVTASSSISFSIIVPVEPNTTYTIVKPKTSRFRVGLFTSYPYEGETATAVYGDRDGNGIDYGTSLTFTTSNDTSYILAFIRNYDDEATVEQMKNSTMMLKGSTVPSTYIPYGYKLPILSNSAATDIYIGDTTLAKDEYVDSSTGKIYRRTKNLSPPEEEWIDEWIWGDGTVHPSTEIKTSPFIDVSTCETCIMEVFSAETEWAAAGYREMAFYDENKQYLGWIGGGGRRALTPNSSENLSEFPAGTVYVRIGCSHGNQPFYPQLVSGYTPVHQFYPYHVPTDPPAPFPQIPTAAGTTVIDYNGTPKPDKVELTYRKRKGQ